MDANPVFADPPPPAGTLVITRVVPREVVATASRLACLTVERRHRLLEFLADARRREAMRGR